ncbi:MAG: GDSL-type esterase/lipase family protein, partial [Myxococcota bacterium]
RWRSKRVRAGDRDVDFFGVAGTFVEADGPGAYGRIRTATSGPIGRVAGLFDLYYLRQPAGGAFEVLIDGRRVERVDTAAEASASAYATFRVPEGPHTFEVRTLGQGPVRLFGVAVERETPGVIVDTLGINGARARYHLLWEDGMYREHLRRRQADLVVIAYGTNESGDELPIERYEAQLEQVVSRVRETAPRSSCLLIGPSDRPIRQGDTFLDRPRTARLIETQHRVALRHGCGFFDLVALSGGPLSMVEWVAMTPSFGAGDYVHYTRRGYQRVAEVLLHAMMEGFEGSD